ncbi:MAG: helix-turn-helix domain-containing protein [Burkholderiales bacterium]
MNFNDRLKKAREHSGMSQHDLAKRSGVKQVTISKIERGDSKSSTHTVELALACGVRPEWLATGTGDMILGPDSPEVKLKQAIDVLQQIPEHALDETISVLESIRKLSMLD